MPCSDVMIVLHLRRKAVILKQVCCIILETLLVLVCSLQNLMADLWNTIWMLYWVHYLALWVIYLCFRDVKLELGSSVLHVNLLHRWNNLLIGGCCERCMSSETTKSIQCAHHHFPNVSGCENACFPGLQMGTSYVACFRKCILLISEWLYLDIGPIFLIVSWMELKNKNSFISSVLCCWTLEWWIYFLWNGKVIIIFCIREVQEPG